MYQDYLIHHGTKGMRWGVRKDKQNPGGNRQNNKNNNKSDNKPNVIDDAAGALKAFGKYKRNKQAYEEHQNLLKKTKQYTDIELKRMTNRLILENNYMNAKTNQNRVPNSKVTDILDAVGSTVKLVGSAAITAATIISAIDKVRK